MSDFKHAIAKKYYGTMFEISLAMAGGCVFTMLLPHKATEDQTQGCSWGCHWEGQSRPALLREPLGCTHTNAIGVETLRSQAGCAVCACPWLSANRWVLPYLGLAGEAMLSLGMEHHRIHPSKHRQGHNKRAALQFGQSLFWSKWNSYE